MHISVVRIFAALTAFVLLLFILIGLCCAVVRVYFRAPDQKAGDSVMIQRVNTPAVSDDLSDEEAEALRSHRERKPDFYTILVSGVDDGNGGSDTNLLVAVDAKNGKINVASLPRDTLLNVSWSVKKLNNAYHHGGFSQTMSEVSRLLGIPVDYTVLVDLRGFEALVNAIGGVEFYIPIDMDYDDPYQDLSIHFTKGTRLLYGEDALKVVRFRHNNDGTGYGSEDVGRMTTQQNFLKAVAKKTLTPANVTKVNEFVKIFHQYVETDLTINNLAWLGAQFITMGPDRIDFCTLPGEWKSPYIYVDPEETLALVNQFLNPYVEDRLPEDLNILT